MNPTGLGFDCAVRGENVMGVAMRFPTIARAPVACALDQKYVAPPRVDAIGCATLMVGLGALMLGAIVLMR